VPYTEAKARWGDGKLYLRLYAGDLDLEGRVHQPDGDLSGDDAFHLELGGAGGVRVLDVSVLGTVADAICARRAVAPGRRPGGCDARWQSHAAVAVDVDGTLNHIHDNDEEWVVELAIPLEALGLAHALPGTRIAATLSRCEIGHDGRHACGGWGFGAHGGELILDP
jgi:hypothetical protein